MVKWYLLPRVSSPHKVRNKAVFLYLTYICHHFLTQIPHSIVSKRPISFCPLFSAAYINNVAPFSTEAILSTLTHDIEQRLEDFTGNGSGKFQHRTPLLVRHHIWTQRCFFTLLSVCRMGFGFNSVPRSSHIKNKWLARRVQHISIHWP